MRCVGPRAARGFSLIELLIVVAVILTIAAIAIPNLMRARANANEASAVASLRAICTAQTTYQQTYQRGYAPSLAALGPGNPPTPAAADLIDQVLANQNKSGYIFSYNPIDANGDNIVESFSVNADPQVPGSTGTKHFFVDASNVIRFTVGGPANSGSPPIPPQ
jgi:prepilin-type N-terminal cleavage/methylation domain-containing protein